MSKDYLKKEPNKTEKAMYELAMHMQYLDRTAATNSAFVAILAMLSKTDPKTVAEYLTEKREEVHEYSKKINAAIDEIEKKSQKSHEGHDHAGHDHSHEHKEEAK